MAMRMAVVLIASRPVVVVFVIVSLSSGNLPDRFWSTEWDLNPCITALQAAAFATSPPVLVANPQFQHIKQNPLHSGSGFRQSLLTSKLS